MICFHISRSEWINHTLTKTIDQVTFPDVIDLTPFMHYKPSDTLNQFDYKLRSVIVHYGSMSSSGHFVAYRLSPSGRKWCFASDEEIRIVDKETVFSSEPYMLFYEKITSKPLPHTDVKR